MKLASTKTPLETLEEFMKKAEKYINYKNVLEARKLKSSKKQNTQKTETQIAYKINNASMQPNKIIVLVEI